MTLQEAINYVDEVKPNAFSTAVKVRWINQIEGRLVLEIFLMSTEEAAELEYGTSAAELAKKLLVDNPYDDVYTWWLQAQIDLANGEYDRAQNTMAMFNSAWSTFLRWFAQRYDPVQGYGMEG